MDASKQTSPKQVTPKQPKAAPRPKAAAPAQPSAQPSAQPTAEPPECVSAEINNSIIEEIKYSIMAVPVTFIANESGFYMFALGNLYGLSTATGDGQYQRIKIPSTRRIIDTTHATQPFINYKTAHDALSQVLHRIGINADIPTTTRVIQAANVIVYHLQNYTDGVVMKTQLLGAVQEVTIKANGKIARLYQNGADILWVVSGRAFEVNTADIIMYLSSNTPEYRQYVFYITAFTSPALLIDPTMDKRAIKARRKRIASVAQIKTILADKFKTMATARRAVALKKNQPPAERLPSLSELVDGHAHQ